jgi:hypothetical protein
MLVANANDDERVFRGFQAQDASSQFLLFREKGPFKMEGAGAAVDATKQQIWEFLPSGM